MRLDRLDPVAKAVTTLLSVILLTFQYLVSLNLAVFGVSVLLLLCSGVRLKKLLKLLLPAVLAACALFVTGLFHSAPVDAAQLERIAAMPYAVRASMSGGLYPALQLSSRLLAYAGMGISFALSSDGEAFVSGLMHHLHLPAKFAYGTLAAVHLMPNMVRRLSMVKLAFRVQGLHPGRHFGQVLFTMLVNSIRWSECVAMAMASKGFDGDGARSSYCTPKLRWQDFAYGAFWLLGITLGMIFLPY